MNDVILSAIASGVMESARGVRVAHVQDQAVRALRQARRDAGFGAVRCGSACRSGSGECRPGRRRHQAAHRRKGEEGEGRSGGFRAIVLFRRDERAFFVHGFAKSDRENLRRDELGALRELARELFELDESGLEAMLENGTISEVNCDG